MKWSFQLPDVISVDSLSAILTDAARKHLTVDLMSNHNDTSIFMCIRYKGKPIGQPITFTPKDFSKKSLIEQAFFEMSKIRE